MTPSDDERARKKRLGLTIALITIVAIFLGIWQIWALSNG